MTNTRETKYNIRYKYTLLDIHKTKCNNRAPPPQHTHTRYSHTLKEKKPYKTPPPFGAPIRTHIADAVDVGLVPQEQLRYVLMARVRCIVEGSVLELRRQQQHTQTDRAGAACVCVRGRVRVRAGG